MKYFAILVTCISAFTLLGCEGKTTHMPGLPTPPPAYPKAVNMPIDPELQKQARAEIQAAIHSSDPIIRVHAMETVKDVRLTDADRDVIDALQDRSMLVRGAAAITVGELKIKAAADHLPQLLQGDPDHSNAISAQMQRMDAIFALHQLGDTTYSHEFEKTAFDPEPHIRGQTAFILGLIGDKSAIPILIAILQKDKDPNVKLQAGEALWRMGNERGEDALLAGTVSSYASDKMLALLGLAEPRNNIVLGHVEGLFSDDYLEVKLVAARAAGMLGSDEGYGVALNGVQKSAPIDRSLAAMAFGAIGRPDAQPTLAKLLKDDNADVRLAAAAALMQIAADCEMTAHQR